MAEKTHASDGGLPTGSGAPGPAAPQSVEAAIGAMVRRLRKRLDMTIADLAGQCGLSTSMLSKVENGTISPSLATLQALSGALNVPISALFDIFEERRDAVHVVAGHGLEIDRRGTRAGHLYQLLGHSIGGDIMLEPYFITLTPEASPYAGFRHDGVEFIYMLSGAITYRHGNQSFALGPGDSLYFDAAAPHGPEILTSETSTFLSVIAWPRR